MAKRRSKSALIIIFYSTLLSGISSPRLNHENPHIWPAAHIRKPSYPYFSQDTFRFIADIFIDETHVPFEIKDIKDGSLIFISRPYVDWFFNTIDPQLNCKYILISTCHDQSSPAIYAHYLERKNLHAWFVQNIDLDHPKVHAIPIGIASTYWPHGNIQAISAIRSTNLPKDHLLYVNINVITNAKVRQPIFDHFKKQPFSYVAQNKRFDEYLIDLRKSKFILSPPGNGLDCHRTWEALLMGSYPVVQSTSIDCLFEDLPVVVVDDWKKITVEFLNQKYAEFNLKSANHEFNMEKIYAAYWINKIRSMQNTCIEHFQAS